MNKTIKEALLNVPEPDMIKEDKFRLPRIHIVRGTKMKCDLCKNRIYEPQNLSIKYGKSNMRVDFKLCDRCYKIFNMMIVKSIDAISVATQEYDKRQRMSNDLSENIMTNFRMGPPIYLEE